MNTPFLRLLAGFLCTAALGFAAPSAPPAIFNGKDLSGWVVPTPNPFWRVEQGVLVGENDEKLTGSMLWTEKSYGDFVFECEARWEGEIDSGVMFRKPNLQVQFGVSRSLKRDLTGSFYVGREGYPEEAQAKEFATLFKPGAWNTFRIEARGDTFTVSINGRPASKYTNAKFNAPGPIGLQIHGKLKMKVEFRNIRAAELTP